MAWRLAQRRHKLNRIEGPILADAEYGDGASAPIRAASDLAMTSAGFLNALKPLQCRPRTVLRALIETPFRAIHRPPSGRLPLPVNALHQS